MVELLSCRARDLVWTSALLLSVSCQWVLGHYDLEDSAVSEPSEAGIAGASADETGGAVASGGEAPSAAGTDTASLSSGGASDIAAVSAAGRGVSGFGGRRTFRLALASGCEDESGKCEVNQAHRNSD